LHLVIEPKPGRGQRLALLLGALALAALIAVIASGRSEAASSCRGAADYCTDDGGHLSYTFSRLPSDHSDCTWSVHVDFGDGTTGNYFFGGSPLTVSHTFPRPGEIYHLRGSATDGHSLSGKWQCPDYALTASVEYPQKPPPEDEPNLGSCIPKPPAGWKLIVGTAIPDKLSGGPGHDCISGGEGADSIDGRDDSDRVYGDGGADLVSGGAGGDLLFGGAGDDLLSDGLGSNTIEAGMGNDRVFARDSIADTIDCGEGDDGAVADRKDSVVNCEIVTADPAQRLEPVRAGQTLGPDHLLERTCDAEMSLPTMGWRKLRKGDDPAAVLWAALRGDAHHGEVPTATARGSAICRIRWGTLTAQIQLVRNISRGRDQALASASTRNNHAKITGDYVSGLCGDGSGYKSQFFSRLTIRAYQNGFVDKATYQSENVTLRCGIFSSDLPIPETGPVIAVP
jgi:RTX calcium-binding nonapeptide repeat (4 copies)